MEISSTGEVTQLLHHWSEGCEEAQEQLLPLVYRQLRSLAERQRCHERQGHTLQTTDLIHEAFLRLRTQNRTRWHNRDHFFAVAASAIRRVLVDYARRHRADKRPGAPNRVSWDGVSLDRIAVTPSGSRVELLDLDSALTHLAELDPRAARIVELRFFAGMTLDETARILEVSIRTITREWGLAKVWLRQRLREAR